MEWKVITPGNPNPKRGFTALEILVVVGISMVLSTVILSQSTTSRKSTALMVERAKIAQVVVRAKSLAISTFRATGANQPCGYGVHFDYSANPTQYYIYSYGAGVASCANIVQVDSSQRVQIPELTYVLPVNLKLNNGTNQIYDVLFIPPDPRTILAGSSGVPLLTNSGNIYVAATDGTLNNSITVTYAGQITY